MADGDAARGPEWLALMMGQVSYLGQPAKRVRLAARRGRPRKQNIVLDIFRDRLKARSTQQLWMRERRHIQEAWRAPNIPDDRTIRRAVGQYYHRLEWEDGIVTTASALSILQEMVGQK